MLGFTLQTDLFHRKGRYLDDVMQRERASQFAPALEAGHSPLCVRGRHTRQRPNLTCRSPAAW